MSKNKIVCLKISLSKNNKHKTKKNQDEIGQKNELKIHSLE